VQFWLNHEKRISKQLKGAALSLNNNKNNNNNNNDLLFYLITV